MTSPTPSLSGHFATASYYSITLPNSYHLPRVLSDNALSELHQSAKQNGRNPYEEFVEEVRGSIRSFLEKNHEIANVSVDTITQFPGNVSSSEIVIAATDTGITRLMMTMDNLLSKMQLHPDVIRTGHAWKNLPCRKVNEGIEFGCY